MIFQPPEFLYTANIYEVNIRQYTAEGTFNAFAAHLPRLKDMGVEILWLMPIHPIGEVKRKGILGSYYSIKDHRGVNPEFGTTEDFRELILKIHAAGMKVIIDWVANHASWDNVWTKTNPDFFEREVLGNFKPPYDWDDVIQIDHTNKNEQAAMREAMQYWISEFDIDGFRADLAHLTPLQFWKDARVQLTPLKKDLIWLAETEDPSYHEAFDISYTWEWMHATEKLIKKECTLVDCIHLLREQQKKFPVSAQRLFFTSNHDENSWNGTEYEKYGVCAKALAVFSFIYPGVGLIYSGQEFPNQKRLKFFEKDLIETNAGVALHEFYKILLAFKKRNTSFYQNETEVIFTEGLSDKNILSFQLRRKETSVLVFLNLSNVYFSGNAELPNTLGNFKDIFTGADLQIDNKYFFTAAAGGYTVLEQA